MCFIAVAFSDPQAFKSWYNGEIIGYPQGFMSSYFAQLVAVLSPHLLTIQWRSGR